MGPTRQDALNDALERLHDVGFTMEPGFSEHGPMVAEAISTLGHDADVARWVEAYKAKRRHLPVPPHQAPIDGTDEAQWRGALGLPARIADWLEFFHRQLDDAPWQAVLRSWVPLLLPGYAGGLTHGLLRTAHAVRSFPSDGKPTVLQREELARGLAYWAAAYRSSPEQCELPATLLDLAPIAADARSVADVAAALSRHTAIFARMLLTHAELGPIALIQLIHTVTAPTALRNLLPYAAPEFAASAYGPVLRTSAAIFRQVVRSPASTEPAPVAEPTRDRDDLARDAVEHGDEHVIKLTEACLREDGIRPDPVYRAAAEAVLRRLPPWASTAR